MNNSKFNVQNNYAVFAIFFASGFPALLYQIVWQRSLFTFYGVNIESVTVVVAAFMLGLGLGSLFGGHLSKNPRISVLVVFSTFEFVIGIYGFNSLKFFEWACNLTLAANLFTVGLITFLLVLIPTLMMGATLPLLVAYLVKQNSNVGRSTSVLYFFNTLGSAFACLCAALFLMRICGKEGSVIIAGCINLLVSASALLIFFMQRLSQQRLSSENAISSCRAADSGKVISFALAISLTFMCGFIALSYEIVWIRAFTVAWASSAAVFPLLLCSYLLGIAWGASEARRFCSTTASRKSSVQVWATASFLLLATVSGFLLVPLAAFATHGLNNFLAMVLIIPAAAFLGATLPLVSHMAIPPDENAGAMLSYLYLANIVGSTLGSLLTGYVLLEYWSLESICRFLALMGVTMAVLLAIPPRLGKKLAISACLTIWIAAVLFADTTSTLYDRIYERLQLKGEFTSSTRFAHVVENRSGVISVTANGAVYGDGIYDGKFNIDVVHDTNLIVRPYCLSAFHSSPREVLMIGLSSGSWAQVIANNPQVEKLTIVEINPGYLQLIRRYPVVASLLENPKVEIVIDDGRRWLTRASGREFDAIVMNTTWHWRAFASNLLSKEFLSIVKAHLKEGGIFYYNTTDSPAAQKTGAMVFNNAYRFFNFMVVSDSQITINKDRLREVLESYSIDGKPVFDLTNRTDQDKLDEIIARMEPNNGRHYLWDHLESRDDILARTPNVKLVTDDNMLTEWQRDLISF